EHPSQPGRCERIGNWLYDHVWKKIYFPDDALFWYRPALKKALQLIDKQYFDAMFTVALPFAAHLVGWSVRKRYPGLKWLADTGDPFVLQPRFRKQRWNLYAGRAKKLEKGVLLAADHTVVTTEAARVAYQDLFGAEAVRKMSVIPPLLHPGPGARERKPEPVEPLRLGYFGTFYNPVRTPDAFLRLLEEGFRQQPEWRNRVVIHFYGEIFPEFLARLSDSPQITLHGLRSREESRLAMLRMHGLVHIGNATDFQLPSKIVEYLAAQKPVFHLSYVASDPFVTFWGQARGLETASVDRNGNADTQQWLNWLQYVDRERPHFEREIAPYLIDSIGDAYLRALHCSV
ncbi:MAG TPA: hypothetical protein PKL15_13685, partial [Saprospiraceae bacterium]|nr:hypothetical protein [Saprospiraceae bacterium]